MKISIIICTYNRYEMLRECFDSLENQTIDKALYEVIIVDNNSTDNTKIIAEKYCLRNSNFRYVFEQNQGLSHARNRGAKEARADWVGYVDDDGKVKNNYIEQALYVIDHYDFDCFGGKVVNWFKYGKPKWYPEIYDAEKEKYQEICEYSGYISGGISFYKKEMIVKFDYFNAELGMNGKNMGVGEETKLQREIRQNGGKIGFNPEIVLEHLVSAQKMTVRYQLRRAFNSGKVEKKVFSNVSSIKLRNIARQTIYRMKSNLTRIFKDKNYAIQNYFLDVLGETFYLLGVYFSNQDRGQ